MTIQDQINKAYESKVTKVHQGLVRETAVRALRNIGMSTPVDTGRARQNWNIAVNRIDASMTPKTDEALPAPDYDAQSNNALSGLKSDDTVYISNNLPYIQRLNDGYSQQAPKNFVNTGLALAIRQAKAWAKRGGK